MRRHDPTTWARRDHYAHYRALGWPYLAVTAEVDATGLVAVCKARGWGLFAPMAHVLTGAANAVAPLRMRIHEEDGRDVVIEHEVLGAGLTLRGEDPELFTFGSVPYTDDVAAFVAATETARATAAARPGLDPHETTRDDLLYLTCLPWLRFTEVGHPMALHRPDTVPRVAWGRMTAVGDRVVCPVNLQAHHALVDGAHVGAFFAGIEARLSAYGDGDVPAPAGSVGR